MNKEIMTFPQAIFLGAIQGVTEFLPISSSAHLVILPQLFDLPYQGKVFDIFLNIGSLLAILIRFRSQVWKLFAGLKDVLLNKKTADKYFFITMLLSSLPVIVVFGVADIIFCVDINSLLILSAMLVTFAFVMYFCDLRSAHKSKISRKDSMVIGAAQTLSLIPGVSRLGACLSMARYLNYSREESFRYSLMLSIPPVTGACFLKSLKIFSGEIPMGYWPIMITGTASAFVCGMISLYAVENFFKKHTFLAIVIYRILFGIGIFIFLGLRRHGI
ncbi:MAG: undecaprenyl-diphosphate phosphatase [Holosporaceae bacterium]|jgi:undecaprenyl-diphosphatase|nr:undecaprenyl-diphosphate phosphatase [Holosporaceae bacterium]